MRDWISEIYLKGIRTTSVEINLIPGNIDVQILEQIINDTETSNMEINIHIQTNQSEKIHKYSFGKEAFKMPMVKLLDNRITMLLSNYLHI